MSAGTRADHNKFCLTEKWEVVRNARGGKVRHHITYELPLFDGRRLRTRVSRPANAEVYGASLWNAILKDQLEVTEVEFWDCVKKKKLPVREPEQVQSPVNALPAGLVYELIKVAGVPEDEVRHLTLDEAVARMTEHWTRKSR